MKSKPVALWKGIVGTVLSSIALLAFSTIAVLWLSFVQDNETRVAILIIVIVLFVLISISFVINLVNLVETSKYKKTENKKALEAKDTSDKEKKELLLKLLSEGKISVEEYNNLSKQ